MYWFEHKMINGVDKLVLYSRGKREIVDCPIKPYYFLGTQRRTKFQDAVTGKAMRKVVCRDVAAMRYALYTTSGTVCEGDVPFENRVMIDENWKIEDVPRCWLDIEVGVSDRQPDPYKDEITAIGMIFDTGERVFLSTIGREGYTEKMMLANCMGLLKDVGLLMTYNGGVDVWETRSFDIPYLAMRYGLLNDAAEDKEKFMFDNRMRHCCFMDLYVVYKREAGKAGKSLAGGFGLDAVSQYEFGEGKAKREKAFADLSYDEMKEYNMHDVELLKKLDDKYRFSLSYIGLAQMTNSRLTGWSGNKKRQTMTTGRVLDNYLLGESRKLGIVWNNHHKDLEFKPIEGALVLEPIVGRHYKVQNYDVVQMYPNIMVHEKISPDKGLQLYPIVIGKLQKLRRELKKRYQETESVEDWIEQYNVKVLANSLYGMLAQAYSRYSNRDLAERVTAKGRELLMQVVDACKEYGFVVVYGDTDSSFVSNIDKKKVAVLLRVINREISPHEVEAGEWFDSILFTGTESGGIKKRYAGLVNGKMKVVGMQAVRRDYCVLSRTVQKTVLSKLLTGEKISVLTEYLTGIYLDMRAGKYDQDLVLSKGVRLLEEYSKDRTYPPHVRALKKQLDRGHGQGFDVQYMWADGDVEPVIDDKLPANIEYHKYFVTQIRAVVDPLLKSVEVQNNQNSMDVFVSS